MRDSLGDTGVWSFALTVVPIKLIQVLPVMARTTTGKAHVDQIEVSGAHGTVTYIESTGAPFLTVSSTGKVSAPAGLAAGTYKAAGTVKDSLGDTGAWSFALTVVATELIQVLPVMARTTTGKARVDQIEVSGRARCGHLRRVGGRALFDCLVHGQGLRPGRVGGWDLQGDRHSQRQPR